MTLKSKPLKCFCDAKLYLETTKQMTFSVERSFFNQKNKPNLHALFGNMNSTIYWEVQSHARS